MTLRVVILALGLALWSGVAAAEAPETAIRPVGRPTPEATLRPVARPGGATVVQPDRIVADTLGPDPTAIAAQTLTPPEAGPVIAVVAAPDAPRVTPELGQVQAGTERALALNGPRQMVLAEELMPEPPAPPVFVDGWTGDLPPLRPAGSDTTASSRSSDFLRPLARAESLPEVDVAERSSSSLRPRLRPPTPVDPPPLVAAAPDQAPVYGVGASPGVAPDAPQFSPLAVAVAMRPPARTERVIQQASTVRRETARGAICGTPELQGDVLAAIRDGGGCGIEEPVRVRSAGGVLMSTPAVMDCTTAVTLLAWINQSARPALRGVGGGLQELQVMGSYACRPRNNQSGARLSEHGKGRAIDIGGFVLASGEVVSVLNHWGGQAYGAALRAMHRDACGPFGTVLGPNANAAHRNHFHFDTARYRSGSYCR
jgi:hypothetical protein